MRTLRLLFATLLFASTVAAASDTPLAPFSAEYSARYQGIPATAQARLQRSGANWTYTMSVGNIAASMNQATVFRDSGKSFLLLGGSDHMRYPGNRSAITTRYDWAARQVRWSGDAKPSRTGPIPLQPGDLDALVMQLALVRDHQRGRVPSYRVLENARARPAHFVRSGTEQLTVGGRAISTTRYTQTRGDKSTTIWVAGDVPAPVQISQREGGRETVRLTMTGWKPG